MNTAWLTKEGDRVSNSEQQETKNINLFGMDVYMCLQPKEKENANEVLPSLMIFWFCYPQIL